MIHILNWVKTRRKTVQYGFFVYLFSVLLTFQVSAAERDKPQEDIFVTFSNKEMSLAEVLADLAEQTGYRFEIPEEWGDISISGTFSNEDLHGFFRRALKDHNFSLIIDDLAKTVIAKDLGGTDKALHTAMPTKVDKAIDEIDPESGMLKEELQKLQSQQLAAMRKHGATPNAVDPMSGMTNGVLREQRQKQMAEYAKAVQDGSVIDPMSGMPLAELNRLREQQMAEFNK